MRVLNKQIECDDGYKPMVKAFYILPDGRVVINVQIGYCKYFNYVIGSVDELKNEIIYTT